MGNIWMVRAGEGGYLIDEFARGYVGISCDRLEDQAWTFSNFTSNALRGVLADAFGVGTLDPLDLSNGNSTCYRRGCSMKGCRIKRRLVSQGC